MGIINTSGREFGQDAKPISITLTQADAATTTIFYSGTHDGSVNPNDDLTLLARGANGKPGRVGQNGANGQRGVDGEDACPPWNSGYSNRHRHPGINGYYGTNGRCGTNGGPGGAGGDGQPGTNGGNAGSGSDVRVAVAQKDLALLDILKTYDVSAGTPGRAGRHGRGGFGGAGGRGGSDSTWWTYTQVPDSRKSTGYREVPIVNTIRGGQNGQPGLNGRTPTFQLYHGAQGSHGSFCFLVQDEHGAHPHSSIYKLNTCITNWQLDESGGLYEPGMRVNVTYQVQNVGKTLISPPEEIPLSIATNPYLQAVTNSSVAGSIKPGEYRQGPLSFIIKDPAQPAQDSPYKQKIDLKVSAYNTRLNRPFRDATYQHVLDVRYPIELTSASIHTTIAQGEAADLRADITNISKKAIGSEHGREVEVRVTDEDQKALCSFNIASIDSKGTQPLSYSHEACFPEDAELGEQRNFYVDVYLKPVDRAQPVKLIQHQKRTVQYTPKYEATTNGFTLVINACTSPKAVSYWQHLLKDIAGDGKVGIWNSSYYKNTLPLQDTLLPNSAKGTLIILDNSYRKGNSKKACYHSQLLKNSHIQQAAQQYLSAVFLVGREKGLPNITSSNNVITWPKKALKHKGVKECFNYLLKHNRSYAPSENDTIAHHVTLNLKGFFRGSDYAKDKVREIKRQLAQTFPARRFAVDSVKSSNNANSATLRILQLSAPLDSSLKTVALSTQQHADPMLNDEDNKASLIAALPFTQKLRFLMQDKNAYQKTMADYISKDLLAEQSRVAQSKTYGKWWELIIRRYKHDFSQELSRLTQLVNECGKLAEKNPELSRQVLRHIIPIIQQVKAHTEQQNSFWLTLKHFFVPQAKKRMIKHTTRLCDQMMFGSSSKAQFALFKAQAVPPHKDNATTGASSDSVPATSC